MHYWDGQPVRFVCCQRKPSVVLHHEEGDEDDESESESLGGEKRGDYDDDDGKAGEPWGRTFWCVAIELAEDGDEEGEGDEEGMRMARGVVDEGKEMSSGRVGDSDGGEDGVD